MTAPLYQKYRPATFQEVVGQAAAVKQLKCIESRSGFEGRAYWLSGRSGTGKSTLAWLIAGSVADDFAIEELDATRLTVAKLRELEELAAVRGWGDKPGRAFVVNESHGLRKDVIRQLLVMLERIPPHVVWIFTTTIDGQEGLFEDCADAHPLLSRCVEITLVTADHYNAGDQLKTAFAENVRSIAKREGLDGAPMDSYVRLGNACKWNMRAMLQKVESGVMLTAS